MSKISCIFDACTAINLIHIDEDEFLIKKLRHLQIYLAEKVYSEIAKNVFTKVDKQRQNQELKDEDLKEITKSVDKKLSFFRQFQVPDETILKDFGKDFVDVIKAKAGYGKDNGELRSTVLAVYLSRTEPTKLFFHTDDFPAKEKFANFFLSQQIGYIEDTADLLVLLYRIDDNFSLKQLDFALSQLFSEYAMEVAALLKKLRDVNSNIPKVLLRDSEFKSNLFKLISKLTTQQLNGIKVLKDYFLLHKGKYSIVAEIIRSHERVFELESSSVNLIQKIPIMRQEIKNVYIL